MYKNDIYVSCIKEMVSPSQCFYSHSTRLFGLVGTGTIATNNNNNITIINRRQVAGGHGHWSGNRSPYGMVIAAICHSKPSNSNNNERGTTTAILTMSESLSKLQRRQKRQQGQVGNGWVIQVLVGMRSSNRRDQGTISTNVT